MTLATPVDAMREYAYNVGAEVADRMWILTDYDVWVRNPHYTGPEQPHPEDYHYEDTTSPVDKKTIVLGVLADLGKDLAHQAEPSGYSFEYRARAAAYEPALKACRTAYRMIRNGADAGNVLRGLRTVIRTGIERNLLERLIDYVQDGTMHSCIERHV